MYWHRSKYNVAQNRNCREFFHLGYVILRRVFRHEILYYDVTMTYFVTKKTLHSTTYTK